MNLRVLDMLAPIPEELVEKYDVVHVGLLIMVVRNENPTPMLENLISLLSMWIPPSLQRYFGNLFSRARRLSPVG